MISDRKVDVHKLQGILSEIEQRAGDQGLPLERMLIDVAVWYFKSQPRIGKDDVHKRLAFLERCLECMMDINALLVDRLHAAEGRKNPGATILIPKIQLSGDLTRLG